MSTHTHEQNPTITYGTKVALSAKTQADIAEFLARGRSITVCKSRKRRRAYVNPLKQSPATLNRMSVDRVNRAYGIPYLFPSFNP